MAVTVIFAGAADGDILSSHASDINAAFNGTGSLAVPVNSASELWVGQFFFGNYSVYESFVDFDLSTIAAGQICTSAVMQTYLVTDNSSNDFYCIALLYNWGASVTTADWQDCAEQVAAGAWWTVLPTAGIGATGAYKSWNDSSDIRNLITLLAGSEINFCLSSDLQRSAIDAGTAYVTFSSTNVAGTTQDPKITVTHNDLLLDHTASGGIVMGGAADVTTVPLHNMQAAGGVIIGGAADVVVEHGPSVGSDIVVEWDLDGDGDFTGTHEDITSRVMTASTFAGRSGASGLDVASGGKLTLTCRNDDDAFSERNLTSPLNIAPNSLKTGRRIRIRTATSVPADPVLLVRDRFNRADDLTGLGTAETGQLWTPRVGTFTVVDNVAVADDLPDTHLLHTIDSGEADHYVQYTAMQLPIINRRIGVIVRWTDVNNYAAGFIDSNPTLGVRVRNVTGGVASVTAAAPIQPYEGMTIGFLSVGGTTTGYVGGVEVMSTTTTGNTTSSVVGLYSFFSQNSGRIPEIDNFHVWDQMGSEVDGIIWSGYVDEVEPRVRAGPEKVATITGYGALTVAAKPVVAAPRLPRAGLPTGMLVGECMARASMLHPPAPLDNGSVTTGCVAIADGKALDLARQFERVERGFIYETNEGNIGYADANRRLTATSEVEFSDLPGAQFGYTELVPLDESAAIVNQVTGQVAPDPPTTPDPAATYITDRFGGSGVAVDVQMPATVNAGDLIIVFIASSVVGEDWINPIWWTAHRDLKKEIGMRVYSHFCDGTEASDTISFYANDLAAAGLWVARIFRIPDWYLSSAGVALSTFAPNTDSDPVLHGWGREPTLFICAQGAVGSTVGSSNDTNADPPDGYWGHTGIRFSSGSIQYDVGLATAFKVDAAEVEQPSPFDKLLGFTTTEIVTVAVRGFNGPHTKATLDNPRTTGGDGRFVMVEDVDSQDEHGSISDLTTARLFLDDSDAESFADSMIFAYADDRPTLSLSFVATKSGQYRTQAIERRVGDLVTVVADNNAGFGANGDYFIENITHKWSNGNTLWTVTYELSPFIGEG